MAVLLAIAAPFAAFTSSALAEDIVWDFGAAAPGTASPVSQPVNCAAGDVSQGNNNTVPPATAPAMLSNGSATGATYPGASQGQNAQVATRTGPYDAAQSGYFEFTLTPAATYRVTLTDISFGTRRTGTGPVNYSIRTSADSYAAPIASGVTPPLNGTTAVWGLMTNPGLGVVSTAPLAIRIYGVDGVGSATAGQANWRIDDLKVSVIVAQDGAPTPTITDVTPLSGPVGTAVTITGTNFTAAPVVRFHGTVATGATVNPEGTSISATVPSGTSTGTGPVTVTTNGGAASSPQPFDVLPQPALTVLVNPNTFAENAVNPAGAGTVSIPAPLGAPLTVTLTSSDTTAATVIGSVVIPAGDLSAPFAVNAVPNPASYANGTSTITATAAGHDLGTFAVTVTNTDAISTSVVVNKYLNVGDAGLGDTVELLVTGTGTAGSTTDMRRMLLKDHSSSMNNDGGGRYRFNNIAFFSLVKAGTLIVITDNATTADSDPSDFVLRLGLLDTTYFTREGTTSFNIANPEMIMIKAQDAPADGGTGAIHSLAGGVEGAQFTNAPPKKLLAGSGSATGSGVVANNSTSSIDDYHGTGATGSVLAAAMSFGVANNNANNTFIRSLRGETSVNGAGLASVSNGTAASPFTGKNYFPASTPAQTVAVSLISNAGPAAVTSVKISVPAAFGVPSLANVSVTGAGAGSPIIGVSGQDITITGTAITLTDAVVISIAGLASPNPSAVTDDGRYTFTIQTAGDAGTLTAIASQPVALVSIPVANLRDVDANGAALDSGKTVAISAVCTEENFNTTGTSAYVQDGNFGINVFVSGTDLALARGQRYAIIGQIIQFNGLTEITPGSAANVIALGPAAEPAPLTVSIPDLLANAEGYEGRLIKVAALSYVSGTWAAAQTVAAADASANPLDVRIQSGSTATTPPSWPATITGIFGQFDNSDPRTGGYQIMPRSDADVESLGGGSGYDGWAAAYPGIGAPEDDADQDGASNLMEYATGSIPNNSKSLPQSVQTLIDRTLTVTWAKGATAAVDPALTWSIEASTTMTAGSWSTAGVTLDNSLSTAIYGDYDTASGQRKVFFHLKVVRTP